MTEDSKTERKLVRVVPNEPTSNGYTLTQGTKVLLPSGEAIPGLRKLTLICEANSTWRAILDCHVEVPEITGVEVETTPIDETRARTYTAQDGAPSLQQLREVYDMVARATELTGVDVREYVTAVVKSFDESTENTRAIVRTLGELEQEIRKGQDSAGAKG